ncbi:hypothetical protein CW703_04520 [Candidatus Bathyarchaeota archaeon]|nr:MAG: hypothetical protein CW703_04520 [Candidatus Bathyarchaeota archaeon]
MVKRKINNDKIYILELRWFLASIYFLDFMVKKLREKYVPSLFEEKCNVKKLGMLCKIYLKNVDENFF